MNRVKLGLIGLGVLIVVFGVGYAVGASGRRAAEQALSGTEQRIDVANARGLLLQARVSLYNVNFGDAQRQLQEVQAPLERVRERFETDGNETATASVATAIQHARQAQAMAGKLDQAANTAAAQALQSLDAAR